MNFPAEFEQRMRPLLGSRYAALSDWLAAPPAVRGVRANTLKCTPERLRALFAQPLTPVPFAAAGFTVAASHRVGSDPLHHAGAYYSQEPSAMSAVTLLAPQPGERVLDLCAAPGGKSTQIAAALGHTGLLWANEYVPARARALAQNLERCGVRNAAVSCGDTACVAAALPQYFDAVLADVPCSGEGMFRKEEAALAGWSLDNIRLCAARSEEILNNAARCVRPGGRLVLSTCTFAPEENEWAVVRFLHSHPDFSLVPAAVPFGESAFAAEAVAAFGDPSLLPFAHTVPLERCRRIFPWHGGEGHFLALFCRAGDTRLPAADARPAVPAGLLSAVHELWDDCFVAPPQGVFSLVGGTVCLLPPALPATRGVHLLRAGVAVAEQCGGRTQRWEPAHAAFSAASAAQCRRVVDFLPGDAALAAFLHGEELRVDAPNGWTAVAVAGIPLGFGKVAGGRLKNRYPKGLRLLGS